MVARSCAVLALSGLLIAASAFGLTPIALLAAQSVTPFLTITPAAVESSGGWTIDWDLGAAANGRVEVSRDGRSPQLLAVGGRGTVNVQWISTMSTYEFRLYTDGSATPVVTTHVGPVSSSAARTIALAIAGGLAIFGYLVWQAARRWLTPMPDRRVVELAITIGWIAIALLVGPLGEFPINDDWAYAWSVKTLVEGGGLQLSDWAAVNLLPQIGWGAVFSLPAGFSFTAVRLSTLTAALIALIVLHRLLREVGFGDALACAGAGAVAINPIYLALANSFNSDVPAFTLFVAAFYALVRGLAGSRLAMAAGIALALVGVLERQSNVVLLPALSAALLTTRPWTIPRVIVGALPAVAGFACQWAYATWLAGSGREPFLYGLQIRMLFDTFSSGMWPTILVYASNLGIIAIYLGLFLFPLLAPALAARFANASRAHRIRMVATGGAVVLAGLLLLDDRRLPLIGNVLERAGVGPPLLSDFYRPFAEPTVAAIFAIWSGLTVVGLAGAAMLGGTVLRTGRELIGGDNEARAKRPLVVFAAVTLALLFAGVGALPEDAWFDRYLLPFIPAGAVLIALSMPAAQTLTSSWAEELAGTAATAILILSAGFGIVTTHDLLASSRTRWTAYHDIMTTRGVAPEAIDAWDLSGWTDGQRIETCTPGFRPSADHRPEWSDFSCLGDHPDRPYAVVYNPAGLTVLGEHSYQRWWPSMTDRLFAVQRDASPTAAAR